MASPYPAQIIDANGRVVKGVFIEFTDPNNQPGVANPLTGDLNGGGHNITNVAELDATEVDITELDVDRITTNVAHFVQFTDDVSVNGNNVYGGNPDTAFSPTTLSLASSSGGGNAQLTAGDATAGNAGGNVELNAGVGGSPSFGSRAQVRANGGQSDGTAGRLELFTGGSGGANSSQLLGADGLGASLWKTGVSPKGVITSGALPTVALVSGAGAQILTTRDVETVTPCTFNPGAATTATVTIEISPDNVTYSTLAVATEPAGVALDGTILPVKVRVPAGWYLKLTANAQAVLGVTTYY